MELIQPEGNQMQRIQITMKMIHAGAGALEQCRIAMHDDRATCHVVFTAMLAEAFGYRVRSARQMLKGRLLPAKPLQADQFDADGVYIVGHMPDGRPVKKLKQNYWSLNPPYTKP